MPLSAALDLEQQEKYFSYKGAINEKIHTLCPGTPAASGNSGKKQGSFSDKETLGKIPGSCSSRKTGFDPAS
jgi:hypothetical protein